MIVGVITESNLKTILETVKAIEHVDIFEWRLDYLSKININAIKSIKEAIQHPIIFTLRCKKQGGYYTGSESERLCLLKELSTLSPDYLDVEYTVKSNFIKAIKAQHPNIKIICSYHNFEKTPEDLNNILSRMYHPHVSIYKIVTYANNIFDNFTVLRFLKAHSTKMDLVSHCMGSLGLLSRILGAIVGNHFYYGNLHQSNLSLIFCPEVDRLVKTYGIKKIDAHTKIFALLGDSVEHSVGHIFHNKQFLDNHRNAVYVKIPLKKHQLKNFFKCIIDFPFEGFSITMPLKEAIIPYVAFLDKEATAMGAVNTLSLYNERWHGTNTDGIGALVPIKKIRDLTKSHVLIIGAGGAAKAIAHVYSNEPIGSLIILNRTLEKAHALAEKQGGQGYDYETFKKRGPMLPFDVVINATPNRLANGAMICDYVIPYVTPNTVVMDVDYGDPSSVLWEKAKAMGCTVISPKAMYEVQALEQIHYWFK